MTPVPMFTCGVWSEPGLFNPLTHLSDLQQLVLLCVLGFSNLSQETISVQRERFPDCSCSCPTTFFRVQLKSEHGLDLAPQKGCFSRGGRIQFTGLLCSLLFFSMKQRMNYIQICSTHIHIQNSSNFFLIYPPKKEKSQLSGIWKSGQESFNHFLGLLLCLV